MSHENNLPNTQAIYESSKERERIATFDVIELSCQEIAITDGGTVTLTVPEHAVGCTIQAILDGDDSKVSFTIDGVTTPTDSVGNVLGQLFSTELGRTPQNRGGDTDEMENFEAIAQTGDSGRLVVHYYQAK